jgi:hypothetical protein
MADDLITSQEIKTLRAGAKTISIAMVIEAVEKGEIIPVTPLKLRSGYRVGMTFDEMDGMVFEHISVSSQEGQTDPADAEIIAKAVIGEYNAEGGVFNENVIHFIKLKDES